MGGTAFTVGIPVLNEEAILVPNTERLLHFLDGLGREYEVLIGSNGSTDSTTTLGADLSRRFPGTPWARYAGERLAEQKPKS